MSPEAHNTTTQPYQAAGIRINTPGYNFDISNPGCVPNQYNNNYCLFSVNNNASSATKIKLTGPMGKVEYTLTLYAKYPKPISTQNYSSNVSSFQYSYIANEGYSNGETVSKCNVDSITGSFSMCEDSGAGNIFKDPADIAIKTFRSGTYAYITSYTSATLTKCTISSIGTYGNCEDSGASYLLSKKVVGMTFYSTTNTDTYAYIVNSRANDVIKCLADPDTGLLTNCVDSGAGQIFTGGFCPSSALYIAFNTVNGITYAYVERWHKHSSFSNIYF